MTKMIFDLYKNPQNIIFTNIKLKFNSKNIIYFEDNDLLKLFILIDKIAKIQNNPDIVKRKERLKFFIFLDEAAILFNSTDLKEFKITNNKMLDYLYQIRKINICLFI